MERIKHTPDLYVLYIYTTDIYHLLMSNTVLYSGQSFVVVFFILCYLFGSVVVIFVVEKNRHIYITKSYVLYISIAGIYDIIYM